MAFVILVFAVGAFVAWGCRADERYQEKKAGKRSSWFFDLP